MAPSNRVWGSDAIAAAIRDLDIPYVALNPGSSYRGLHDSLVNYLGNANPRMLLCLHEESAVAIAHGWAKVTGRPMLAIVHSNVGLMHATMAIFNAWCDRAPVIVLGANGPLDATRRRPWIEWIHTTRDQAALIRDYIKWDDQPASVGAAVEAVYRANLIAATPPRGPVYISFDLAVQEDEVVAMPALPAAARHAPPLAPEHAGSAVEQAARLLTDRKAGATFPTGHPLHAALAVDGNAVLAAADVILSLDWIDLAGTLRGAFGRSPPTAKIIQVSLDQNLHRGWVMD